jgi:urease accessory protein
MIHPLARIATRIRTSMENSDVKLARLRLWQLISPALPVGAYAYSQGQEYAVHAGWIDDESSACDWIVGQLRHNLAGLDIPIMARLYDGWLANDRSQVDYWNRYLLVSRESAELRMEDQHLGAALARVLDNLEVITADEDAVDEARSFACQFALACVRWQIPLRDAAEGYLWSWCENQVAAAIKLVPLGQSAGQRILSQCTGVIPNAADYGLGVADDKIGLLAPGVAIASALHETQYSRLFRS